MTGRESTVVLDPVPVAQWAERPASPDDPELAHWCATHPAENDPACTTSVGCVSYCGVGMDGWEHLGETEEPEDGIPTCLVCQAMKEADRGD